MCLEQARADVNPNTNAKGNSNDIDSVDDDRNDHETNATPWEPRVVFCPYVT